MPRLEAKLPLSANSRSCSDFEASNSVLIIYLQMNLTKTKKEKETMKVGWDAVSSMAVCVPVCLTRAGGLSKCIEPTAARHNLTKYFWYTPVRTISPYHFCTWLATKDFLCPCSLLYYGLFYQPWSSWALAENKPESPFKVTSLVCTCQSSLGLSQQSFKPWLSTSTSKETEFLHPHHTHRPRDSLNSAARLHGLFWSLT